MKNFINRALAAKKKIFSFLCALSALLITSVNAYATDYTIETIPTPATPVLSYVIPLVAQTSTASSVTQQVFLASELSDLGASAGNITGIKFYYGGKSNSTAVPSVTRNLKIYMQETTADSLVLYEIAGAYTTNYRFKFVGAGKLVYDGSITTEEIAAGEVKTLSISFNQGSFSWDGSKNIILTVFDVTNTAYSSTEANLRFELKATPHARFAHQYWTASGDHKASDYLSTLAGLESYSYTSGTAGTAQQKQVRGHLYVPKTTFTITPSAAPTIPSTPEDLAASPSVTSASLSWTAVDGATSYMLAYSTDGSIFSELATPTSNSYEWTGLTAASTYYVKVAAVNSAGSSDFSAPISFTTLATHIHDGISFEPWSNPSALPTSGNYYLANDVALDPYDPTTITLTGNLNLCLNGHTANVYGTKIVVPDGKTLAIYDNVGNGKLTGFVASEVGAFDIYAEALICVYSGGTLVLKQGTIENTYIPDEYSSYAIYSNGTLHISGDVLINSNSADIYLYASNIIVLDGAISNAEKHTVWKNGGTFTSGWSTYMSGENPRDFFESANAARSVCLNEGEASLRMLLSLSESSNNSAIGTYVDQVIDVNLTRSLTSAQYNTFCLPFALNNAQLEDLFGAGYDLEEFVSSSLDGDVLTLAFNKVTSLTAGKPYLLQPSVNVSNPSFVGVTITETDPVDITTTYVDFKGVYRPTELEGGNKNLLFLGANDELFWPETTGNIKGFRAYFEVKGSAAKAAKHARIVKNESQTRAIDNIESTNTAQKRIIDGQLFIEKNGTLYNACGQRVK